MEVISGAPNVGERGGGEAQVTIWIYSEWDPKTVSTFQSTERSHGASP